MVPHAVDPVPDSGVDLIQHDGTLFGDWRDDFHRDGFAIVKNVISSEKAEYYKKKQIEWLQSFNLGFDPNDESTWTQDHLPVSFKGGMYFAYASTQEKFVWEARMEPKVQEVFTKLWGTDELLCSFDGMNITLPRQKDLKWSPWPHCDQSPHRKGMQCVQGLLNYQPNGDKDGGLIVMKGSSKLFDQFFSETREQDDHEDKPPEDYDFKDLFIFKEEDVQWFKDHGCELIETNLEPGDLAIWDSRTMHYAKFPEGDRIRHVQYICMTPRKFANKEALEKKAALFKRWHGTTHWPHTNIHEQGPPLRNGVEDPLNRYEPLEKPEITKRLLQLAAVEAY
ncbi:putative phytanoyl-CoA dioxygenase [Pseudocercospora fuligena]|uniref:Putative phytanoyl-CoA dioxygenase n=1 Tax=Pseudocercospora fuligena TaxID=685502 RepID=A0A8H6VFW4_9PEZI|nr:putative phytanoyl-CoA dioxygenase [Pseudocercospora fuligena]